MKPGNSDGHFCLLFHCTALKTKSTLKITNGTPAKKQLNDLEANGPMNRSVGS